MAKFIVDADNISKFTEAIFVNRGTDKEGKATESIYATIMIDDKCIMPSEWCEIKSTRIETLIGMLEVTIAKLKEYSDAEREANNIRRELGI